VPSCRRSALPSVLCHHFIMPAIISPHLARRRDVSGRRTLSTTLDSVRHGRLLDRSRGLARRLRCLCARRRKVGGSQGNPKTLGKCSEVARDGILGRAAWTVDNSDAGHAAWRCCCQSRIRLSVFGPSSLAWRLSTGIDTLTSANGVLTIMTRCEGPPLGKHDRAPHTTISFSSSKLRAYGSLLVRPPLFVVYASYRHIQTLVLCLRLCAL